MLAVWLEIGRFTSGERVALLLETALDMNNNETMVRECRKQIKDPALNTPRSAPGGYHFRNIFCILNRAYMKKNDNGAVKTLMFYIFWREKDNM